jgi:hypothetical protein
MTDKSVGWGRMHTLWTGIVIGAAVAASGCASAGAPAASHAATSPAASQCDANIKPAALFDRPPAFPGYSWCYKGHTVGWQVVTSSAGPAHCAWETAAFLTIAWPPGTYSESAVHARQYIRDPLGVTHATSLRSSLELQVPLPVDATPTGLRLRGVEIYVSPSAGDDAVYVVGGGVAEQWPRSDPMTLCV